ncbi:hypothetical protein PW52_03390 [Tamlana sedimentorum]|uniref:Uncharacterized protein n=1 Tax=Neotamlana sedimentorum TaxID=1435349 RepID=A0A0D7WC83_9FLAO|nr:hypothetical protein [Tamlana sedimentorum]KJD36699.1 hypothetical protein PW52_03390 [Tamlana sedimentorum]
MKLFKLILFVFLTLNHLTSQELIKSHDFNLEENDFWYIKDKKLHTIYQYNGDTFKCFDYIKGQQAWEVSVPGFKEDEITLFNNHPYIKLTKSQFFSDEIVEKTIAINRITGKVIFDTSKIEDYKPSEIFYSRDNRYALILHTEKIKRDKKKGIEKKFIYNLSLIKMSNSEKLWTMLMPEPEKTDLFGLKLNSAKTLDFDPISNEEAIVFSFGKTLFSIDVITGNILWQKNFSDLNINKIYQPKGFNKNNHFIALNKYEDKSYNMDFISFKTGEIDLEKRIKLGSYYNIKFNTNSIMVKSAKGLNYVNYDGTAKWEKWPKFEGKIESVFQQDNNHLIIEKIEDSYYANCINDIGEIQFQNPFKIYNKKLRDGFLFNDVLVAITDYNIITYDINHNRIKNIIPLAYYEPFKIDHQNKKVIYSQKKGKTVYSLDIVKETEQQLTEKNLFEKGKDTISRIEIFNDKYAFLSSNEMVQYNANGEKLKSVYFKPKSNIMKTIAPIAILALGTIFSDEVNKINQQLYKYGLKNTDDFYSDLEIQTYTHAYGIGDFGAGVIALGEAEKLFGNFNKNKPKTNRENPFDLINKLWFITDKIENVGTVIKIIDINLGDIVSYIPIGNKDFSYSIDETAKTVILRTGNNYSFYSLDNIGK